MRRALYLKSRGEIVGSSNVDLARSRRKRDRTIVSFDEFMARMAKLAIINRGRISIA